jgi:hypothetical protein
MNEIPSKAHIGEATNGAAETIEFSEPYVAEVTIQGVADLLFHRWNSDAVAAKAAAAKGSRAKKSDAVGTYVWRDDRGMLCLPGEYVRGAIVAAAKFRQDPRSPRKSAADLYKAGVVALTNLASLGSKDWDYEDRRRVMVQRQGITRVRPAMREGWRATLLLQVNLPEYIPPQSLNETIAAAGRLVGVGDFRPTIGRFCITKFELR